MKQLKSLTGNKVWQIKYIRSFEKKMLCEEKIKLSIVRKKSFVRKKRWKKNKKKFYGKNKDSYE